MYRQLDFDFLAHLLLNDGQQVMQKAMNAVSGFIDAGSRKDYAWWANFFNLFSQNARYELDEFWNFITPEPAYPSASHVHVLTVQLPVSQTLSRNSIPVDYVLNRLQEIIIRNILDVLGTPDFISQYYFDRYYYLPCDRFTTWDRLTVLNQISAYWAKADVWLQIYPFDQGRRQYTLYASNLAPWVQKSVYGLAVMLSGYQCRVGQVHSDFGLRSFPQDVQQFSDAVQQLVFDQSRVAVLVSGKPGTGKTAWTQAIAQEVLVPLGYVIFILDHDAVENFVPPTYLDRICLIINEADNLAQDRSNPVAQGNNKTEHILSLLDGTLYRSVQELTGIQTQQRLVVLMTCNTTDRLDPAMLRKGRVDLSYEFTHCFVD